MPGSRLMSTTGPSNPSSRKVAAAVPPVLPPPTITIGFVPVPSDMRSFNSLGLDREDGACETLVGKSVLLELVGLPAEHRPIPQQGRRSRHQDLALVRHGLRMACSSGAA